MSKAFTREPDEETPGISHKPAARLPPGVTNYITAQGMHTLRHRLELLLSQPATPSTRQAIDELQQSLKSAVVVEPPPLPWNQVLFGAHVTVSNQHGERVMYRLVGVDETNWERNEISWRSPIAKALLKARTGDRVHFRAPAGDEQLTILDISYQL